MTDGDAQRRELLDDVERIAVGDADALFTVVNTQGVSADLAREFMCRSATDARVADAWLNLGEHAAASALGRGDSR